MPNDELNRPRSRLLVVACAEVLRPIFARWATDSARELYERVVSNLWKNCGAPSDRGSTFLSDIKQLPESDFDDSHHRESFVMLALNVLYDAVEVVQNPDAPLAIRNLKSILAHLANELDVTAVPSELESAVISVQSREEAEMVLEIRQAAVQIASKIDAALDPVARSYGWTPDRQRGPA